VTSDKAYRNDGGGRAFREDDPLGGADPYSSSKACAEIVTAAYRSSFFSDPQLSSVAVGSARAGNVIGGGDWSDDRLIPDIMKAIVKGESVLIRRPDAIRPWQHVLEPLSGYLILAQRLYEGDASAREAFNFGPQLQDCKNVDWVTKKLVEKWGQGAKYEMKKSPNDPHEATFLRLDCTKAIEVLGWKPQWSLDEALERIVQWNRSFQTDMANTRNLCLREIDDYMKSLNQA
jgi:CDP-glucose 4,6-dehydratase